MKALGASRQLGKSPGGGVLCVQINQARSYFPAITSTAELGTCSSLPSRFREGMRRWVATRRRSAKSTATVAKYTAKKHSKKGLSDIPGMYICIYVQDLSVFRYVQHLEEKDGKPQAYCLTHRNSEATTLPPVYMAIYTFYHLRKHKMTHG